MSVSLEHDVFQPLCLALSGNRVFMDLFLSTLECRIMDERIRASAIQALGDCFECGTIALLPHLESIAAILEAVIVDPSATVRRSASCAISEFCEHFEAHFCFDRLILAVLGSLKIRYDEDLVEALSCLFGHCRNADSVFDACLEWICPLLESDDLSVLQHVFPCLAALCDASRERVNDRCDTLFGIMSDVIRGSDPKLDLVQEFAIECLQTLALKSVNFRPHLIDFVDFLTAKVTHEDDAFRRSVLRAIGVITQKHAQVVSLRAEAILGQLVQIDDVLGFSTTCAVLAEFPEFLDQMSSHVFAMIERYSGDCDDLATFCRALALVLQIAASRCSETFSDGIMAWAVRIIHENDNSFVCAEAVSILVEMLQADLSVDSSVVSMFFDGSLACNPIPFRYDEVVYPVFSFFFKLLIQRRKEFATFAPYIQQLIDLTGDSSVDLREFGLQILGQLIENCSGELGYEFVENVLQLCLSFVTDVKSSVGMFCLSQCATAAPSIVHSHWDSIFPILLEIITAPSAFSDELVDNTVNTLGCILQNPLSSFSPIDHISAILGAMPAKAKSAENPEMMRFFLWLYAQTNGEPRLDFAAVLIRFFSTSESDSGFLDSHSDLLASLKTLAHAHLAKIPEIEALTSHVCEFDGT
jgi:hypothetical protein